MRTTVAECEINQAAWHAAVAVAGGGDVWQECGLRWSWQPHDRQLMLNFPRRIEAAAVRRGVEAARTLNACIVGAWLGSDVDASPLEAAGFERGCEPWWMTAPLTAIADPDDRRVTITNQVPEYGLEGQRLLSLAEGPWHAVASASPTGITSAELTAAFRRSAGAVGCQHGCRDVELAV